MVVLTMASCLLLVLVALGLFLRARPILSEIPLRSLLFSSAWHPLRVPITEGMD